MTNKHQEIKSFLRDVESGLYVIDNARIFKRGKPFGYKDVRGYQVIHYKKYKYYAHRLLYAYYFGYEKLNESLTINHIDGDKQNNEKENLEQISLRENTLHQWRTGLAVKGEDCNYNKLNEEQIHEIRHLLDKGYSQYVIADLYKVSRSAIEGIKLNSNWSHLHFKNVKIDSYPERKSRTRSDRALTDDQIQEVYKLLDSGEYTQKEIGKMYGVSRSLILKIKLNRKDLTMISRES